eukprot:m.208184 g.208184  ORF g.208184 m.208184 type:complete len:612 (+) comp10712_c0_seq10:959-2794(+)
MMLLVQSRRRLASRGLQAGAQKQKAVQSPTKYGILNTKCSTKMFSARFRSHRAGWRAAKCGRSCVRRRSGKESSVHRKSAPAPNPPAPGGSCAARASWRQSCVLPTALLPVISVIRPGQRPPRRSASSGAQPKASRSRCIGDCSSCSAVTGAASTTAAADARSSSAADAAERPVRRASSAADRWSTSAALASRARSAAAISAGLASRWCRGTAAIAECWCCRLLRRVCVAVHFRKFCAMAYAKPARRLMHPPHLALWKESPALGTLLGFIQAINKAVHGKPRSEAGEPSPAVAGLVALLDSLDKLIDEIPPVEQPSRFGNAAFRTWHTALVERAEPLLKEMLPENLQPAIVELAPYLAVSFGNETRIDYGTGHELAFAAFLCCLALVKFFSEDDLVGICLHAFSRYLDVVRKLQETYRLEPAGSHGVWGLDDYQFLPYYWGASQLIGSDLSPADIPVTDKAMANADEYLFFDAIKFIHKMKTGPFFEHSRYLFDISNVKEWSKVNSGMLKMYRAEVLDKFPIVQHFLFGTLLTIDIPAPVIDKLEPPPKPVSYPGGVIPGSFPGTGVGAKDPSIDLPAIAAPSYGTARVAERGSLRPRPRPAPQPDKPSAP